MQLRPALLAISLLACAHASPPPVQPPTPRFHAYFAAVPDVADPVYMLEAGEPDAPPVVLVHGLGDAGARDFEPILADLSRHHRVLAFDLPAFARSSGGGLSYSPDDYARFVHHVVSARLQRPVAVLGHSMGGAIAALYAANYPDEVSHLALLDVAGVLHFRDYARTVMNAKLARRGSVIDPLRRFAHALFRLGSMPFDGVELTELPITQTSTVRFIQYDFGPALRRVQASVFLGWGKHDTVAPLRTMDTLAYLLRPSRSAVYASSAHFPMRTEPQRLAADLNAFFAERPRARVSLPEPASSLASISCRRERGRVLEGDYDHVEIDGCKDVVLQNVRARTMRITRSSVYLKHVELMHGDVGLSAARSRLVWAGGHIVSNVCVELKGSQINLAGVECVYRDEPFRTHARSDMIASVSGVQRAGARRRLHGQYTFEAHRPALADQPD